MSRTGVVLIGFGGPDCLDSVGPFMCNLMGREPSEELVARVRRRYLTIGGKSPLLDIATDMANALEADLADMGHDVPVRVGMRYWHPFIDEAFDDLVAAGCSRVIAVSLSPFESKVAHGAYREAIAEVAERHPDLVIDEAPLLSTMDAYADFYALSTASALNDLENNEGAIIAFTAHSLPVSDLEDDDPYVAGLSRLASTIAERLGLAPGIDNAGEHMFQEFRAFGADRLPRAWFLVYQSKGQRPGAWLGPEIDDLITALADTQATAVVTVPLGFATDHMETLYDLDVVVAGQALDAGLEFMRAVVPNNDEQFMRGVAGLVAGLL